MYVPGQLLQVGSCAATTAAMERTSVALIKTLNINAPLDADERLGEPEAANENTKDTNTCINRYRRPLS
jgi:hypothetical protein